MSKIMNKKYQDVSRVLNNMIYFLVTLLFRKHLKIVIKL